MKRKICFALVIIILVVIISNCSYADSETIEWPQTIFGTISEEKYPIIFGTLSDMMIDFRTEDTNFKSGERYVKTGGTILYELLANEELLKTKNEIPSGTKVTVLKKWVHDSSSDNDVVLLGGSYNGFYMKAVDLTTTAPKNIKMEILENYGASGKIMYAYDGEVSVHKFNPFDGYAGMEFDHETTFYVYLKVTIEGKQYYRLKNNSGIIEGKYIKCEELTDIKEDDVLGNPEYYNPFNSLTTSSTLLAEKVGTILGAIRNIGITIGIIMLSIIGLKYILGSVEEKAQYKESMKPFMIGAIILMAGTTIVDVIYSIAT